jgi:hypothetical protein
LRFVPRAVVRFRPRATPAAFFTQYYRYARGDGKADLWRTRHAVRYGTYVVAGAAVWYAARDARQARRLSILALLLAGGIAYTRRPFVRLAQQCDSVAAFLTAAPLVPLARFIGDAGKMCGYPVGVAWRWRRRWQLRRRRPRQEAAER